MRLLVAASCGQLDSCGGSLFWSRIFTGWWFNPFKKVLTTWFNGGYPVCGAGLNSKTSNHERVHLHVPSQSQFVVCRDSVEMCQRDGLPTWMLLAYQKISSR